MTPAQRSLQGRIGAAMARSRHSPADLTRAARRRFLERFEEEIRAEAPELPLAEIQRRAMERRRAHMLRLAAKSAQVRKQKDAAAPGGNGAATDAGGHGHDRTAT